MGGSPLRSLVSRSYREGHFGLPLFAVSQFSLRLGLSAFGCDALDAARRQIARSRFGFCVATARPPSVTHVVSLRSRCMRPVSQAPRWTASACLLSQWPSVVCSASTTARDIVPGSAAILITSSGKEDLMSSFNLFYSVNQDKVRRFVRDCCKAQSFTFIGDKKTRHRRVRSLLQTGTVLCCPKP